MQAERLEALPFPPVVCGAIVANVLPTEPTDIIEFGEGGRKKIPLLLVDPFQALTQTVTGDDQSKMGGNTARTSSILFSRRIDGGANASTPFPIGAANTVVAATIKRLVVMASCVWGVPPRTSTKRRPPDP